VMAFPSFPADERPALVLTTVGAWYAERMPGFRWVKSRHSAERRVGTQIHELTLQPSTHNRAGHGTVIYPRFSVQDSRLADWVKNQNGPRQPASRTDHPYIYSTLLTNPLPGFNTVEISGLPQHADLQHHLHNLDELIEVTDTILLPTFDLFATPTEVAKSLPDNWISMVAPATVEWALALDDRKAAQQMVHRLVSLQLKGQQTWESRSGCFTEGYEMTDPGPTSLAAQGLRGIGWICRTHHLMEPGELTPPTRPAKASGLFGRIRRRS
jgi:hypothetical protein